MANDKEIYRELPNEFGTTSRINTAEFLNNFFKQIPNRDCNITDKSVLLFPKTKPAVKNKPRKEKKYLSRKEKLKLNLLECPKTGWNYKVLEPLRQMWRDYMRDYLDLRGSVPTPEDKIWPYSCSLLAKADYHGAEMSVIKSKCPSIIGVTGTCILDTKNTFKILSKDNKCRTIPKIDSVFKVILENMELTIYGKYIMTKSAERSSKKVKSIMIPVL